MEMQGKSWHQVFLEAIRELHKEAEKLPIEAVVLEVVAVRSKAVQLLCMIDDTDLTEMPAEDRETLYQEVGDLGVNLLVRGCALEAKLCMLMARDGRSTPNNPPTA